MTGGSSSRSGGSDPRLESSWADHPDAVLRTLGTSVEQGLSAAKARRRLRRYGPNRLLQTKRRSGWRILWDQFESLIVGLLVVAAAVTFAFDEVVEGFAIVCVIFLNAGIGFLTERRAVRSMEGLRELGHRETTVRRVGSVVSVPASLLVPADIVVLDAGDILTADVRLISASRLQADAVRTARARAGHSSWPCTTGLAGFRGWSEARHREKPAGHRAVERMPSR